MRKNQLFLTVLLSCFILVGCSSTFDPVTGERSDPLQRFNRTMWNFNYKVLDPYVLKPIAQGWEALPTPLTVGLSNVANNLDEPVSFVNRLLGGELRKAMVHFNRFVLNTFFGLGGIIDFASHLNDLKIDHKRSFSDTLGNYGIDAGSYIILPVYNAITPREITGALVESAYTYPFWHSVGSPWALLKVAVQKIDERAKLMDKEILLERAQDPYIAFREAYYQNLEFRATDGDVKVQHSELSEQELNSID